MIVLIINWRELQLLRHCIDKRFESLSVRLEGNHTLSMYLTGRRHPPIDDQAIQHCIAVHPKGTAQVLTYHHIVI